MDISWKKLDNPVWNSLTETHQKYSVTLDDIKFYSPEYSPFGSSRLETNSINGVDAYSKLTNHFYIVGEKPQLSLQLVIHHLLPCYQMILDKPIDIEPIETIVALTTDRQKADLLKLVNIGLPGFICDKTSSLGRYYGIYKNNELVAVTGERMQMNGFTEISAVVTHPEHLGRGYSKQLIKHTADGVFKNNQYPFLHVLNTNTNAVGLYKHLGFETRRIMNFWNIKKL